MSVLEAMPQIFPKSGLIFKAPKNNFFVDQCYHLPDRQMTSRIPYDTHPVSAINRVKLDGKNTQ